MHSHKAQQGMSGNWVMEAGCRRCKPGTSLLPHRVHSLTHHHHQVITLDPLSPWGYEIKHTALREAGDFDNAVEALETMLSKIAQSPELDIRRESYPHYHDKDGLFTLFDRAWRQVHQPIEHTSNDSQNCSTDYTSFAACAHQHDHWPSLQ